MSLWNRVQAVLHGICLTGGGWEGGFIRGRRSRAQLSVFPSHQSPLVSVADFFFFSLCSSEVAVDAEDRLQTETSSGNVLKLAVSLSDRGAGHFYAPLAVSQTFVSSVPPPHILITCILSLRCLLQWSPMPTTQDGIRTSQRDTFITLGLLEFSSVRL